MTEMTNLSSEPSNQSLLRPLDHHGASGESQRLIPTEVQLDVLNDQNQEAIEKPRDDTGQNHDNNIILPPEIEMLTNEDPQDQQLQAILESEAKQWIRRPFIFCLMLILGVLALDFGWDGYRIIFTLFYAFLSYFLIENIIQFKTPEVFQWKKIENAFTIIDTIVLLFMILATDLKFYVYFNFPLIITLGPLWANFFFYTRKSQAPPLVKKFSIIIRILGVVIYSVIIFVFNFRIMGMDSSALGLLLSGYTVPFSTVMIICCLLTALVFICSTCFCLVFYFYKRRTEASQAFYIALGSLWVCLWSSNGFHPSGILLTGTVLRAFLPASHQDLELDYLIWVRNINIIFCLFTLVAYKKLKKCFIMCNSGILSASYREELEKIVYPNGLPIMKKQINLELTQLSSTYFTSSKNKANEDIVIDTNKEHLCYICYREVPDAVMASCGHGGICVECAIATIKSRRNCSECRQKVQAILKIDLSSAKEHSVKAVEAIIINRKQENADI